MWWKKILVLITYKKKNDELSTLLSNAKVDAVTEFKSSNEYTKLLEQSLYFFSFILVFVWSLVFGPFYVPKIHSP